ncbi:MAG TPA: hypothetical protein PLD20_05775 [Blastocatellia bacterium]|nr:hypothetical protein [Blastocatellia bacterium]HMX24723.1 hypothetical protein [Blastocatellia bacterium]HMY72464.1 hypothetical protein [Blastocatellia bacterium]HMZ17416.1 hypothetical protein [Blastocatellia bacterium]HNG29212.1 hypothetical protein [Blastocatellia bacterium]
MNDIAGQILNLARLAEAPVRDFRQVLLSTVVQRIWTSGDNIEILPYNVPEGYNLVVTRVDSWVSGPYNPATSPGAPLPTQPVLLSTDFRLYWQVNNEKLTGFLSPYFVMGQGEQLIVFPGGDKAQLMMAFNGISAITPEQAFGFRVTAFLTLPEHGERLLKNQTLSV